MADGRRRRSADKERGLLAMMAGRASTPDDAEAVGAQIECRARATYRGARGRTRTDTAHGPREAAPYPATRRTPTASGPGLPRGSGIAGDDGDMTELSAGMLLVATPVLLDPNFVETVVLLLDRRRRGRAGVVLNRPSAIPVDAVLAGWARRRRRAGEVLFQGGPVSTQGALAVATLRAEDDVPVGFRSVGGRLGLLDLDTPVELLDGQPRGAADLRRVRRLGGRPAARRDRGGQLVRRPGARARRVPRRARDLWRDVMRRCSPASGVGLERGRWTPS